VTHKNPWSIIPALRRLRQEFDASMGLKFRTIYSKLTWWEHGSLLGCWATRLVQGHLWKGKSRLPNVAALPARALFVLASFATQLTLSKTRKGEPKKLKDILLLLC
jgi:hypothetical protein